jgi:hypothetical protein
VCPGFWSLQSLMAATLNSLSAVFHSSGCFWISGRKSPPGDYTHLGTKIKFESVSWFSLCFHLYFTKVYKTFLFLPITLIHIFSWCTLRISFWYESLII